MGLKMSLTKHWCLDRNCGFEETSHKIRDGAFYFGGGFTKWLITN
ncbi:hypothetical protein [Bacillus thuringiensis]|nr:hypothetical protein [Bacillus thuringiensis]MEB9621348.1 hypothetical protein [Bacillus cereus]